MITLSATVHRLKPPPCSPLARQAGTCAAPSALQRAVLYVGMGLLVVSAAGTNPTSLVPTRSGITAKIYFTR